MGNFSSTQREIIGLLFAKIGERAPWGEVTNQVAVHSRRWRKYVAPLETLLYNPVHFAPSSSMLELSLVRNELATRHDRRNTLVEVTLDNMISLLTSILGLFELGSYTIKSLSSFLPFSYPESCVSPPSIFSVLLSPELAFIA